MSRHGGQSGGGEGGVGLSADASPGPPGGATSIWRSYGSSVASSRHSRTAPFSGSFVRILHKFDALEGVTTFAKMGGGNVRKSCRTELSSS